jgi:hypothetical protein
MPLLSLFIFICFGNFLLFSETPSSLLFFPLLFHKIISRMVLRSSTSGCRSGSLYCRELLFEMRPAWKDYSTRKCDRENAVLIFKKYFGQMEPASRSWPVLLTKATSHSGRHHLQTASSRTRDNCTKAKYLKLLISFLWFLFQRC